MFYPITICTWKSCMDRTCAEALGCEGFNHWCMRKTKGFFFVVFTDLVYIGRSQSLLTWNLVPRISLYCCMPEDDLELSLPLPFPTCWECRCELLGADNFFVMFCLLCFVVYFCNVGDQTQGLGNVSKALYHWASFQPLFSVWMNLCTQALVHAHARVWTRARLIVSKHLPLQPPVGFVL